MVRHLPVRDQWEQLCRKLTGHYNYYGIPGNSDSLSLFCYCVRRIWQKWLNRRTHKAKVTWDKMAELLKRFPLPLPHVYNPYIPLILRVCDSRSRMR
jgi:RNA-directed DNA polymerase